MGKRKLTTKGPIIPNSPFIRELFKESDRRMFDGFKDIADNGTTHITIETPEGWKCERPNCPMDYLHKHTSYNL